MRNPIMAGFAVLGLAAAASGAGAQPTESGICPVTDASVGTVSGTVLDVRSGVPLRDAKVFLDWDDAPPPRKQLDVRTNGQGGFTFCDVPAGALARIRVEYLQEYALAETVRITAGADSAVVVRIRAPHIPLSGRVVNASTSDPIADATLRIDGTPLTRTSDAAGRFTFDGLPPGAYDLHVAHIAYQNVRDSLVADIGTNLVVEVRLATNAIPLEPIIVDVRSLMLERRGFYQRMERGVGTFLTRDRMQNMLPLQPSDVLRTVAGVRLQRRRGGFGQMPVGRGGCGYRYVIDGARVGPMFEIDDVPIEWIEALEVYQGISSVPAEFAPMMHEQRATCGLIVIWTRNRA